MKATRRACCVAALLGLAGCTDDGDPTGELDADARPVRPSELTSDAVADYLAAYERAYVTHEGIDRSAFDDPDDAVAVACEPTVHEADDGAFYGIVQCAGRIDPDVGDPATFELGLGTAPLYRVTEAETVRIDPQLTGPDSSEADEPTVLTSLSNVSDAERTVAVEVVPADGDPVRTERTLAPGEARNVNRLEPVADRLDVTVEVDGAAAPTVRRTVDGDDAAGVYAFVGPDGEPTVATASPADVEVPDE